MKNNCTQVAAHVRPVLVAGSLFVSTAMIGSAAVNSWTNTTTVSSWETNSNWNLGTTPTIADSAFLTNSGTYTVKFNDNTVNTDPGGSGSWLTVSNLTAGAPSGLPTLLLNFTNTARSLTVGTGTAGNLTVGGYPSAAPGSIVISNGTLSTREEWIGNAGQVNLYGGTNIVSGADLLIGIASSGAGQVLINGGTLIATNMTKVGIGRNTADTSSIGAKGTLIVSNGTFLTSLSSGSFIVGFAGNSRGEWDIYGGTNRVQGGNLILGGDSLGGTGVVLVAGGLLDIAGGVFIGSPSYGNLTVSNGTVMTKGITVGRQNGGDLNIFGGSTLISNGVFAMASGSSGEKGSVLLNGGSLIQTNTTLTDYWGPRGAAKVTISNGTFFSDGYIRMGGDNGDPSGGVNFNVYGGTGTIAGTLEAGQYAGTSAVLVANSGVLEFRPAGSLIVTSGGASLGTLTNRDGGTLRFMANNPSITKNASGILVSSNAVIEFKDVAAASLSGNITKITQTGDNTLSLNNATNALLGSYTFKTNNGQNFAYLRMINGGTRWQASDTTIGSGGTLLASNTSATIQGVVTNLGTISVVNSHITFGNLVTISGTYVSDPSTSTFTSNVTVTASGTLAGGPGDLFDFKKSLIINSTNNAGFNLASSVVSFSGGGNHTNAVTGGDFGTNLFAYPNANFTYGALTLASTTDQLYFVSGGFTNGAAASNALYVTQLNLFNDSGALKSNLVSDLHSPFNIYYQSMVINPGNAYLNDQTFSLGGGFLMPFVPEPSALGMIALAFGALGLCRARRR